MLQDIRDLLERIAREKSATVQETKLLSAAFAKAATAVLDDPALATQETIQAFVTYTTDVEGRELRCQAISRLGTLAIEYPEHSDDIVQTLIDVLEDPDEEVASAAVYRLKAIAEENGEQREAVVDSLIDKTADPRRGIRLAAVQALTSVALKFGGFAPEVMGVLSGMLAEEHYPDTADQSYVVRHQVAQQLGKLGLTSEALVNLAVAGLAQSLQDEDVHVRFGTIEALCEIAEKYVSYKDTIVERLREAQDGAIFTVRAKIDRAITSLVPPAESVTPEQAALGPDLSAEHEAARAEKETAVREAQARKDRMEGIRTLANKLPGAEI